MAWNGNLKGYRTARKRRMQPGQPQRGSSDEGGSMPRDNRMMGPDGYENRPGPGDSNLNVNQAQDMTSDYSILRKQPDNWPANRQMGRADEMGERWRDNRNGRGNEAGDRGGGGGGGSEGGGSSNVAYMHFPKSDSGQSQKGEASSMYSIPTYPASLAVNGGFVGGYGGGIAPYPVAAGLQQSGTDLGTLLVSNAVAEIGTEAVRGDLHVQETVANLGFNLLRDDKISTLFAAKDSKDTAVFAISAAKDAQIESLRQTQELSKQFQLESQSTRDLIFSLDRERTQREFDRTERRLERAQQERDNDRVVAMLGAILNRLP